MGIGFFGSVRQKSLVVIRYALGGVCRGIFSAYEIERRADGARSHKRCKAIGEPLKALPHSPILGPPAHPPYLAEHLPETLKPLPQSPSTAP